MYIRSSGVRAGDDFCSSDRGLQIPNIELGQIDVFIVTDQAAVMRGMFSYFKAKRKDFALRGEQE